MRNRCVRIVSYMACPGLLAFFILLQGCTEKKTENKREFRAIPVILGQAATRRVEYTLNQVGSLKASQEVTIRSEIAGRIIEISFTEGKGVEKGQVLVRLDAAKIRAEIRSLKARIKQLHIRLANRNQTLERHRPLVERDMISRETFDKLLTEMKEIEAEIVQARANLALQQERLADTIIRAPFDGVAGARNISLGDYLKAGDPVVTVVDLDPLEISFQVPERFKPNLSMDQEVLLRVDPYPDRTFRGAISFISPQVDLATRTFQVKAQVRNNQPLLNPGMFARVAVITEVHDKALSVPWEGVIQTEDETYIYVVEEGNVARKVPVRLGRVTQDWAEVLEAELTPGARVILEGKFAVKDGIKVAVQGTRKDERAEQR